MEVCRQVFDAFAECQRPELMYVFKREVAASVDDVIRDLAGEAAIKDAAREMKRRLAEIVDPEVEESESLNPEWNWIDGWTNLFSFNLDLTCGILPFRQLAV